MACVCMRYAQLWATWNVAKSDAENQRDVNTDRQRYSQTYKIDWNPLGSFGTQCGNKFIAMLDNHTWNNNNEKISKGPWMTRRVNGRTYYTATQAIWLHDLWLHALHAITGHAYDGQHTMWMTRHRERETERLTDR